ncbi:MAG: PA0069 family radical SAM protein, partial [Novosphingobium sp.]|nr:PA0069 family radical SAM protein [Novosphingobium sp.]
FDDGWQADPDEGGDSRPKTEILQDTSRSVLTFTDSPDIGFDRSVNPYRGCEHGCIYCYARPTHAFLGLSPGLDFETRIFAKPEAPSLLAAALAKPGYRCRPIALGTNTDPYQPIERSLEITRGIIKVLSDANHPLTITTKSVNVVRDIDLLAPMAAKGLASVAISVTTLDPALHRMLEPRTPSPARRLDAVRRLAEAGVPVSVMAAPMIPALNDRELEAIIEAAAVAGARSAAYTLLRLPLEVAPLFEEWLKTHAPLRAAHVLSLVRGTRDGRINDSAFGRRMVGSGPYALLLAKRFALAAKRSGLDRRWPALDVTRFVAPQPARGQLRLL